MTKSWGKNEHWGAFQGKKLPANIDADAEEGDVSDEDSGEEEEEEEEQINGDVRCFFLLSTLE